MVLDIKKQNEELQKSISFMSDGYDDFLNTITTLENEKCRDRKVIDLLEQRVEALERKSRASSLEIRNVPTKCNTDSSKETKQELSDLVAAMDKSISVRLDKSAIKDIFRIKSAKEPNRPIVVEFDGSLQKEEILSAVKKFNKSKDKKDKLNTEH